MTGAVKAGDETQLDKAPGGASRGMCVVVEGEPPRRMTIDGRGVSIGSAEDNDLVLSDRKVSRRHARLAPHPAGASLMDLESRNGTFVAGVRVREAVLSPGARVRIGPFHLRLEPDDADPPLPPSSRTRLADLVGASVAMRMLFTLIERVAASSYTVLIEGETGTGKGAVARALHALSTRADSPFVTVDCASTSAALLESELFGHVRGAFTGAHQDRLGAFRRAAEGTLFLDELSSIPPDVQAKLLTVLESRLVRPVGGDEEQPVDFRIVAATNRPLLEEVRAGRFREDLYFRLAVVRAIAPPLRERLEDIPVLVEHFLRHTPVQGPIEGANLDCLLGYEWPGNVRELRNVVERGLALRSAEQATFAELPLSPGERAREFRWPMSTALPFKEAKDRLVSTFERTYVALLIRECDGNVSKAARRSGLSRRHLHELLRKYGLSEPDPP